MVQLTETLVLDAGANVRRTADGYLVAQPRVARTGVQTYLGREVGINDKEIVGIMRPEGVVFDAASMKSYANRPITFGHPPEQVTADNWKKYAVGTTGAEVLRDGEYVRVPMMLTDRTAIDRVLAGDAVELSLGYEMGLDYAAKGDGYDASVTSIRANHLAIVDTARGGPELNILEDEMTAPTTIPVTLDGMTVQVADQSNAQLVQRYADQAEKKISDLETAKVELEAKVAKAATDAEEAAKKIEGLEKAAKDAEMTPEKMDALVADAAKVREVARHLLGADAKLDGRTTGEIRKAVVLKSMGDTAKDYDDAKIATAFDVLSKDIRIAPPAPGITAGGGGVQDFGGVLGNADPVPGGGHRQANDAAYAEYVNWLNAGDPSKDIGGTAAAN